jgi:Cu(I)/Ag(I) efflux system membrane fusion protein
MKKTIYVILAVVILAAGIFAYVKFFKGGYGQSTSQVKSGDIYYCPMHPTYTSDKPGECPICHMSLVKRETAPKAQGEKKILYYRNPMNPEITSPVPMKDQMGMDYIPVYAEEQGMAQAGSVYIGTERQQLIGVKKEKVEKRKLTHQIITVGRIAYDPGLFTAQQEYLQSLKGLQIYSSTSMATEKEQAQALVNAARQKLLIMGMSNEQIEQLAKDGKAQQNLYLSIGDQKTVWVYLTIYEYEIGLVKEGLSADIEAVAFPGEVMKGTIAAISPVFDASTRSVTARLELENPQNKLKPNMYVNAKINVELGEKLAVPEDAVMDTGLRKIVVLALPDGYFQSKQIKTGERAQGYFEVLEGLNGGEEVVTSANFLIDSESKLNAAISGMSSEPNKMPK